MISIIIPTYNEEGHIGKTLQQIMHCKDLELIKEIIVVDGGSTDGTVNEARAAGVHVILSRKKGRAAQMNAGADFASAPVLYFLHADSRPPEDFVTCIARSVEMGNDSGCFRLRFDHPHWFLKSIAWFTRFNTKLIRFGDQSLFIKRRFFREIAGFDETCIVMEDHDIIRRISKQGRFGVLPSYVTTSARKFLENGPYRLMSIFLYIYLLYYLGVSQRILVLQYRKLITNGKL